MQQTGTNIAKIIVMIDLPYIAMTILFKGVCVYLYKYIVFLSVLYCFTMLLLCICSCFAVKLWFILDLLMYACFFPFLSFLHSCSSLFSLPLLRKYFIFFCYWGFVVSFTASNHQKCACSGLFFPMKMYEGWQLFLDL